MLASSLYIPTRASYSSKGAGAGEIGEPDMQYFSCLFYRVCSPKSGMGGGGDGRGGAVDILVPGGGAGEALSADI